MPTAHDTFNLAWQHHQAGNLQQAEMLYRQVLYADPGNADALCFLGALYQSQRRFAEAEPNLRRALEIVPGYDTARKVLGAVIAQQGRLDEAAELFEAMLARDPNDTEVLSNLGLVRSQQCHWDEALKHYNKALALDPNNGNTHWNRALAWLTLGDFEHAWPEFEWRWSQVWFRRRELPIPIWDGSDPRGRTILLHSEQGLGDCMQFIRYAALIQQRGGRVIFESPVPLAKLLAKTPGIDVLVKRGDPLPPAHARAEVMSLPYLFKTLLNTVPAPIPYIFPDDALVQSWREELARALPNAVGKKFRVGIVWQGSVALDNDRERSIELATFAPLAAVPGVQLVSLQKGRGTEQIQALQGRFPLLDLGGRLDEANGAFVDTAAVMKSLDLVISSDTSVPHLAGAMGIPVWIAIAKAPDWRWMLEREDTPWYPTMRLFRRGTGENWDQLFARIAGALSDCSKRMNFA